MKRALKLVLVIMLLLCVVSIMFACGEKDDKPTPTPTPIPTPKPDPKPEPEPEPDPEPVEEEIAIVFMDGSQKVEEFDDFEEAFDYMANLTPKTGYDFDGWYADEDLTEEIATVDETSLRALLVDGEITVYLKWKIKTFIVRFEDDQGNVIQVNGEDTQTVEYGQPAVAPADPIPDNIDLEFKGWDTDFSSVKANLIVKAIFGGLEAKLIAYGYDGQKIGERSVEIGKSKQTAYSELLELAESSAPIGLSFVEFCTDLTCYIPYEGEDEVMEGNDVHLYSRVEIPEIGGLNVLASRDFFAYDGLGFTLNGSHSKDAIITYSYEWFNADTGLKIYNATDDTVEIGALDVGKYSFGIIVTATYENDEIAQEIKSISAEQTKTITVNYGSLEYEGLVAENVSGNYTGLVHDVTVRNSLPSDTLYYKLAGTEDYSDVSVIKNAGKYNVDIKLVRTNYNPIELNPITVNIEKATLNFYNILAIPGYEGSSNTTIYYGEEAPKISYSIEGFVNGEDESVLNWGDGPVLLESYMPGYDITHDNGLKITESYWIGYDENQDWVTNNLNYNIVFGSLIELQVERKAITIMVEDKTVTYGDGIPNYSVSVLGSHAGEEELIRNTLAYTCDYVEGSGVKAGGYDIAVCVNESSSSFATFDKKYAIDNDTSTLNGTLSVVKRTATVALKSAEVTFGDDAPTYGYTLNNVLQKDETLLKSIVAPTCTYGAGEPAGNYVISVREINNANYNVLVVDGTLKVKKRNTTISLEDVSVEYFSDYPSVETFKNNVTATNLYHDTDITSIIENAQFVSNYAKGEPVNLVEGYPVTISGLNSKNYNITVNNGKILVTKKTLNVTILDSTVVYGDTAVIKVKVSGLVGADKDNPQAIINQVSNVQTTYKPGDSVGSMTISATANSVELENYTPVYSTGTLQIVAREIVVTARGFSATVGEAWTKSSFASTDIAGDGLYLPEETTVEGTLATVSTAEGAYSYFGATLSADFTSSLVIKQNGANVTNNYKIVYDIQVAITALGVFVSSETKYYDGTVNAISVQAYDGRTVEFLVEGNYTETAPEYVNAGTYTVTYRVMEGAEIKAEDREITVVINPLPITLSVASQENLTYGDAIDEFTHTYGNANRFVGNDTFESLGLSYVLYDEEGNAVEFTNVLGAGAYDVRIEGLNSTNYDLTAVDGILRIRRKELTLKANDVLNIKYGDAYTLTSVAEGFVNGESLESLNATVLYTCGYTNNGDAVAGTYDIIPRLFLDNYNVVVTKGTLDVAPRPITLAFDNLQIEYGSEISDIKVKLQSGTLASWDVTEGGVDISKIGALTQTTDYQKGSSAGQEYDIQISGNSAKYAITFVNEGKGTVEVVAKKVYVNWAGVTNFTYDGLDRSATVKATYVDILGATVNATVSFRSLNAASTSPNRLLNAAEYEVTAVTADSNYELIGVVKQKINVAKAVYSSLPSEPPALSGVYSPDKTLKDYEIELIEGFYWTDATTIPVVKTNKYSAYYNGDPENYVNYDAFGGITLEISPALVSLGADSVFVQTSNVIYADVNLDNLNVAETYTFNPTIYYVQGGKVLSQGQATYTISFSNGNTFTPGTHLTEMTFTSENYKLNVQNGDSNVIKFFIKYRSVSVYGKNGLYTLEDALNEATSGSITVKANTSFANQEEVRATLYNNASYYTVKSGVTLLLPYSATDTSGFLDVGESGSANYNAHPVGANEVNPAKSLYLTLTVPENVTLNVNGVLTVGALTGRQKEGRYQNAITGGYAQLNLSGIVALNNATLNVYGYIMGSGKVVANGSTQVTENMYLSGWEGGTISAARFMGTKSVSGMSFMTGGKYTVDNPVMFPFNQYELRSIQATLELNYGASLRGVCKIATSEQGSGLIKAKISIAYFNIVSSSTDAAEGLIRMTTAGDKVTKSYVGGRIKITLDGQIVDGYTELGIPVAAKTVMVTSEKVFFPVHGSIDIIVNSGTFTQSYKFKLLPGATLTVKSGATYNVNGTTITYKTGFTDTAGVRYTYTGDAKVIVEGTLNVNGSFGGSVYGLNGGRVNVASGATITGIKSTEGSGTKEGTLTIEFTFNESQSQTRNLELYNASGTTAVSVGGSYSYDGAAWA